MGFCAEKAFGMCPILETRRFTLRVVRPDDAEDLLKCYSDPKAQDFFDHGASNHRYQTIEEMSECIRFFLSSYEHREFVRFAIIDKETKHAIGTVEMFDATGHLAECDADAWGVLRLDLASAYERQSYIEELLMLCLPSFYGHFDIKLIVTKAIPAAKERIVSLRAAGFTSFEWPDAAREHYWVHNKE